MNLRIFCVFALSAGLALAGAARADVTVGSSSGASGDCAPFGCITTYQQAYASSLFTGTITITGLEFYNTVGDAGTIDPATYTITLSSGGGVAGSLSDTFANNIGSNATTFFSGALSGSASPNFTITGTTPFTYDPSSGDLLITIAKTDASNSYSVYLDARAGDFTGVEDVADLANAPSSTTGSTSSLAQLGPGYGLVTTFITGGTGGTGSPSPAPEPEAWVLALAGFAALGARLRARRAPGPAGRAIS